ncbi:hypothetical protein O181_060994 [Austropuccinia psidii MF-1]|uniref:Uncharacterized protein n=1 Tax=Austropuccinia psidii MF-1 TaxID=1389203 RepID=A0A9Q3EHA6_9BASI|nr:hypothetical protein [Austropuccinia psidii MF-1]
MENGRQGIQIRVPLHRTCTKYSEDFPQKDILQRTYHRGEMEQEITYSDPFRLMRTGNPTRLPGGLTPLRHQHISDQELPYFPIPGRIQERKRIIGQEKDFFHTKEETVSSYGTEVVGPSERNTRKQQTVVSTSHEASSPKIRNDI